MDRKHPEYLEFKQQFWSWFDSLPKNKKEMFWQYKDDMSETNFYFTVYSKKQLTNKNL
jgi:hypothetical protein